MLLSTDDKVKKIQTKVKMIEEYIKGQRSYL